MTITWRCEFVRCGKRVCKSCPHGPYWYGYHREGDKVKKRYHGKADPRIRRGDTDRCFESIAANRREAIFNLSTATPQLAHAILNTTGEDRWDKITSAYKMLVIMNHPDRGGDTIECQYISAAYSYLKAYYRK